MSKLFAHSILADGVDRHYFGPFHGDGCQDAAVDTPVLEFSCNIHDLEPMVPIRTVHEFRVLVGRCSLCSGKVYRTDLQKHDGECEDCGAVEEAATIVKMVKRPSRG